ncbi:unnamed protein product [Ciceribacter sp. T2.26MG-112.2]|nr:unnamed protein product [Ciceribacter naphthalenivorans]
MHPFGSGPRLARSAPAHDQPCPPVTLGRPLLVAAGNLPAASDPPAGQKPAHGDQGGKFFLQRLSGRIGRFLCRRNRRLRIARRGRRACITHRDFKLGVSRGCQRLCTAGRSLCQTAGERIVASGDFTRLIIPPGALAANHCADAHRDRWHRLLEGMIRRAERRRRFGLVKVRPKPAGQFLPAANR